MDRYGKDGKSVYYATLTKIAKGESIEEKDNPCWDTHKMVGFKIKNGKKVPNCVPKEEVSEGIKMPDYGKQLKQDALKLGMKVNFQPSGYFLLVGKGSDDFKHHQKIAKKLGMTATNYNKTVSGGSRTELKEDVNEMTGFNVPELIKTTIHRLTHPKGYKDLITKYMQRVKDEKKKSGHQDSNGFILADVGREFGFDRIKPIQMYINKLVRKGQLPQVLAAELEKEGIKFLDSAVSGTSVMAKDGDLIVIAGGKKEDFEACTAYFEGFSRGAYYMGPVGSGARTKLVINLILAGNRLALAEGLVLGHKAGLEQNNLLEVLKDSAASSKTMIDKGPKMINADYSKQGQIKTSLKDNRLMIEQGQILGSPTLMTSVLSQIYQAAYEKGYAEKDTVSFYEIMRGMAGLDEREGIDDVPFGK